MTKFYHLRNLIISQTIRNLSKIGLSYLRGGGTPLYKVTLCAAQMGGFLAIFSLEMGLFFAKYSYMFLTFPRSGSQIYHFWSKPKYSELKPLFKTKFDTVIPKYILEMDTFSLKWAFLPEIYYLEMGPFWISVRHTPVAQQT